MKILKKSPLDQDAIILMEELSKTLESITGNSGKHSFGPEDVTGSRVFFAVEYKDNECAVGCGAIREYTKEIAEVKRMYAKNKGEGIGGQILQYLQNEAKKMRKERSPEKMRNHFLGLLFYSWGFISL